MMVSILVLCALLPFCFGASFDPDKLNAHFGEGGFGTGSASGSTPGFNFNPDKLNQNFGSGGFGTGSGSSGSGGFGTGSGGFGSGGFGGQPNNQATTSAQKFDPNSFTAGNFDPNKQNGFGGNGFDPNSFGKK